MTPADRLRGVTPADFDRDLLEFLGREDGSEVVLTPSGLTVNGQTIPLADFAEVGRRFAAPARSVLIADLPGTP